MDGETLTERIDLGKLTPRERVILDYFDGGMERGEIAKALFNSPKTIDTHRANIMEKFGWDGTDFRLYLRRPRDVLNLRTTG